MMSRDPDCRVYEPTQVKCAAESGAISKLLVIDKLVRTGDVGLPKKYVAFLGSTGKAGCEGARFSSQPVKAERLDSMTGVAAILRFPLLDLHDSDIGEVL